MSAVIVFDGWGLDLGLFRPRCIATAPAIAMLGGIHMLSSEDTRTRGKQNTMRSSPFDPAFRAVIISFITCSMASLSLFELRDIFGFSPKVFLNQTCDVKIPVLSLEF